MMNGKNFIGFKLFSLTETSIFLANAVEDMQTLVSEKWNVCAAGDLIRIWWFLRVFLLTGVLFTVNQFTYWVEIHLRLSL